MKSLSRIFFPAFVAAMTATGILVSAHEPVERPGEPVVTFAGDTVIYKNNGYKERRNAGQMEELSVSDSLIAAAVSEEGFEEDTLPRISARDTIKIPDSLRFTDPFRFKYYLALVDSLSHVQTRDSLMASYRSKMSQGDTLAAFPDSLDRIKIDSIYVADSTTAAKLRFIQWYNSLSKEERKKYDMDRKMERKLEIADSLMATKEEKKALRDSIIENTPRILETFALVDSMQYKRLISWTVDRDFQKMDVQIPDTSYNYHFYDYPFLRKDVNANWLGVAGSPLQYYDYFNRTSETDVEFYKASESWTYTPGTLPHYNTKTPYTELSYNGTLLAKNKKESDNIHLFTTQNITPALNIGILVDRYGGGGMLENEKTINKTFSVKTNYLGKRYLMHAGYIYNKVDMGENGGMTDIKFVRDTVVDSRDIPVYLKDASSSLKKHTVFVDQQLSIPFTFIKTLKARKDSTYTFDADSLDKDITTAFIGHSSEFSTYSRKYDDLILSDTGMDYYRNVANYDGASADSMRVMYLDNKFFIKLQPWSSTSVVSKLNIGIGDYLRTYYSQNEFGPSLPGTNVTENSLYAYAGAEGQIKNYFNWDAKAKTVFLGADFGDFEIGANARFNIYPFRRAKYSPISFNAHFETSLKNPTYYQKHISANHFKWDRDFSKISTTKLQGEIDIPHWRLNARVGYALLGNNIYYNNAGIVMQNPVAMSVFSASLRKDLVLGILHLDNRVLFQASSNNEVVPVPTLALNLKYFIEFVVQKDEAKANNILVMQFGVNGFYNTLWNAPAWNPNLGVFYNQNAYEYRNGPYFDVFLNMQWKRCCIFIKYQNATAGLKWPVKKQDYFSSDRHIITQAGLDGLKLGIFWPFSMQPSKNSGPVPAFNRSASAQSGNDGKNRISGSGNVKNKLQKAQK